MTAPWRAFRDARYFDLWCVRHSDDREFGAGFHLAHEAEAIGLRDLLNAREEVLARIRVALGPRARRIAPAREAKPGRRTLAAWLGACAIVVAPAAAVVLMFPPASFSGIILAAQLLICWLLIIGGCAICIAMLEREVRMLADGPINTTAAPPSPTARARGAAE